MVEKVSESVNLSQTVKAKRPQSIANPFNKSLAAIFEQKVSQLRPSEVPGAYTFNTSNTSRPQIADKTV